MDTDDFPRLIWFRTQDFQVHVLLWDEVPVQRTTMRGEYLRKPARGLKKDIPIIVHILGIEDPL